MFCVTSSIGMSKLGSVGQVEDIEAVFHREPLGDFVIFTSEMSARFCQDWRKMLRWPWW